MDFEKFFNGIVKCSTPLKTAFNLYWDKRKKLLSEIILSEMRQGDFSRVSDDDKIAISHRLMRDAAEGIAKNNLRLMARLICGLNEKQQLKVSIFQKYANILADLSSEEIIFLADLYRTARLTPTADKKDIVSSVRGTDRTHILYGLLRTGFFVPHDTGDILITSNTPEYTFSKSLIELFSLYSWEDINLWDWE